MKTILVSFPLLFILLSANAQTSTWGNPDYISLYSQLVERIDTIHLNKGDIEVRLWFHDGNRSVTTVTFIALTKQNNKWDASHYTLTGIPKRKHGAIVYDSVVFNKTASIKVNYDSLYNQLVKDSILTLNSDSITKVMDKKGQRSYMFLHAGPTNYTIQILMDGERRVLNYRCPKFFYYEAKIDEFEFPLKVISSLLKIMGVKEPC